MRRFRRLRAASLNRACKLSVLEALEVRLVLSTTVPVSITQTQDVSSYVPGSKTTYTFTVDNTSSSSISGATLADTLPAGLSYASATIAGNSYAPTASTVTSGFTTNNVETFNLPALAPSVPLVLTLTMSSTQVPLGSSAGSVSQITDSATLTLPSGYVDSDSTISTMNTPVGYYVIMTDTPLSPTAPAGSTASEITSVSADTGYTLRQLVNYYDYYSNATSVGATNGTSSSTQMMVNLEGGTYTFSTIPGGTVLDDQNQLTVNNPNSFVGGRLPLVIENGVINGNFQSRVFNVIGASLTLEGVTVENGQETGIEPTSTGSTQKVDAQGGGIYVGISGNVTLSPYTGPSGTFGTTVEKCYATAPVGTQVGPSANVTRTTRHGAGYNAAGGGIYGAAGSDITISASTVITQNRLKGGRGATVNNTGIGHGGNGGSSYGAGLAVEAPASGTGTGSSNTYAILNLTGGAIISANVINEVPTSKGALVNSGGTGGACSSKGKGGAGGNAQGAGMYIGGGLLNLNGSVAAQVTSNVALSGKPGSSTNGAGSTGLVQGAVFYQPSEVATTVTPLAGGFFQFNNASPALFLPTVSTAADAPISFISPWNLRTAVAAANELADTGTAVILNLPSSTLSLASSANSPLIINSTNGSVGLIGAGGSNSIISAGTSATSIFNVVGSHATFSNLGLSGAKVSSGNGGAINASKAAVGLTSVSVKSNSVSSTTGSGGGIYQSGGTLSVTHSTFMKNSAAYGGAVALMGTSSSFGGSSLFNSNSASYFGGGLDLTGGASMNAASVGITSNKVTLNGNPATNGTGYGGGLFGNGGSSLNLNHSTIKSNTAWEGGGGVGVSVGTLTISNGSVITMNSANNGFGGGVFSNGSGHFTISASSITSNSVGGGQGGGLYNATAAGKMTSDVVNGNTATGGLGGGMFLAGGTLNVTGAGSTVNGNSSSSGGGFYNYGANLTFKSGQIKGNTTVNGGGGFEETSSTTAAPSVHLTSAKISSNTGTNAGSVGGGIYQYSGTLNLAGSVIKHNSASSGGGIFINNSSVASTIKNTKIVHNSATVEGAGILFSGASSAQKLNLSTAKISSNSLNGTAITGGGGGLYLSGGTVNASGLTVALNSVTSPNSQTIEGGGVYNSGTTVNFANTNTVDSNTLTGNGSGTAYGAGFAVLNGGILTGSGSLYVQNNGISNTSYGVGGGAAFFSNSQMNFSGSGYFLNNKATSGGTDYAFTVSNTGDNTAVPSGASGINSFTNGSDTLRGAVQYAENFMNGNGYNHSMAIMLTSAGGNTNTPGNYVLSDQQALSVAVPSNDSLTIIGTGVQASIQGDNNRVLNMNSGTLLLQNLDIVGGNAKNGVGGTNGQGGGIDMAGGTLTLSKVTIEGNVAGYTGAAAAGANGGGSANYVNGGHAANGASGANGAAGYGGGVYLGGGTLNLFSNSSITGNSVYGQNGGVGGSGNNGYVNFHVDTCDAENTSRVNGGNGGSGGSGGEANGGGLYQAGGTIYSPSGGGNITGNTPYPGTGGKGGSAGGGGNTTHGECGYNYNRTSSGGSVGIGGNSNTQSGGTAYGVSNFENGANGNTVLSEASISSSIAAMSVGGLYLSGGTLNASAVHSTAPRTTISGITVELHSDDGTLIATTRTDSKGRFFFDTTYTGMGYIQVIKPAIFDVVAKGSILDGIKSQLDPHSLRSNSVQIIDGVAVNAGLSFALKKVPILAKAGANSFIVSRTDTGQTLFSNQLMPSSYKGGFTVAKFDFNVDHADDYVLITKTGTPQLFIIDGRSGAVTKFTGDVSPALQSGMVIKPVNLTGGSDQQFLLLPTFNRSGRMTAVDLQTKSVLWSAPSVPGGHLTVSTVSTSDPSRPGGSDVTIYSHRFVDTFAVIDGSTGKLTRFIFEGIELVNAGGMTDPDPNYQAFDKSQKAALQSVAKGLNLTPTPDMHRSIDMQPAMHKMSMSFNIPGVKMTNDISHVTASMPVTQAMTGKVVVGHTSMKTHDAVMAMTSVKALRRESRLANGR